VNGACPEWLDALCADADSEQLGFDEADDMPALERHLATCPGCRAALEALRSVDGAVKLAGYDDPGPSFTRGLLRQLPARRSPSFAAALAVLLAGGAGSTALVLLAGLAGLWYWLGSDRSLDLARGAWTRALGTVSFSWAALPPTMPYLLAGGVLGALAIAGLGCWLARSSVTGLKRTVAAQ
jgi:hypothetical protein